MTTKIHTLTETQLQEIHKVLQKGDRVELIPLKDKIKVIRVRRDEINPLKPPDKAL